MGFTPAGFPGSSGEAHQCGSGSIWQVQIIESKLAHGGVLFRAWLIQREQTQCSAMSHQ
jgi:hypothetical protein